MSGKDPGPATDRVRVISPHSIFRGREGTVRHRYSDGACSVILDGEDPRAVKTFRDDEVGRLGNCALCGRGGITEAEAGGCEDCSFSGEGSVS